MGSLQNATKKTNASTMSPSHSQKIDDSATNNLNNHSPVIQRLQSPSSLFAPPRLNLDQQTSYRTWSQQPQLPGSEIYPQALLRTPISTPNTPQTSTLSYDTTPFNQIEYQVESYDRSTYNSQYTNTDVDVKLNQTTLQKKRTKANEDDDCKHCNCKKAKCLKLYCECFSSGYYCAKTCNCQGCYNTAEYEDTVQESRERIETRNPLAFAPKGNGIVSNPIRGCNCKKAMCQKKYCDCYQSNIGCSSACRCEGCENVYGKKQDHSKTSEMLSKRSIRHISGITYDEKLQNAATQNNLPQTELQNPYTFSSQTSSFPYLPSPPASNLDRYFPNGNSPQYYQNFGNSPTLPNSRNYAEGRTVPKRLSLQRADISDSFLQEYGVSNSFDHTNVFNDPASPITSSNYLPLQDSQYTLTPPFGENMYSSNKNNGYTPPNEVKSISSSPQAQMFNSSTSLRSARSIPLPSVHLFPPLSPLVDPKGKSSRSEKKGDYEDIVSEKRG